MNIRKELISILLISALAFVPGLFISPLIENLLNLNESNAISSLLALVISGVIALPIYAGVGYRLKVSSIIFATDSIKKKLAKL